MSAVKAVDWSPRPSAWPSSWAATVWRSKPVPICHWTLELNRISPATVPPLDGGGRKVSARTPAGSGIAPMRVSPEPGVALLGAVGAQRVARVGDQGEVEVGVGLPGGGGLLDLILPGGGGGEGVHGLEQGAGRAADAGAVGHEAVGDPAGVGPLADGRVEQHPS